LVATILEHTGLPAPCSDMESTSLLSALQGADLTPDRAIFCGTLEGSPMLRRGRFKHIWHSIANVHILYDLQQDPGETQNLAADPQFRTLLEANVAELKAMLARPVPNLWRAPSA
ncbi:MAG: hypothetical protein NWS56_01425, partial [Haliea sp.]|nr:hypothetical protein [Haliea sp.]